MRDVGPEDDMRNLFGFVTPCRICWLLCLLAASCMNVRCVNMGKKNAVIQSLDTPESHALPNPLDFCYPIVEINQ